MMEWWSSLAVELRVFYAIGIGALVLVTMQILLALVGAGAEDVFDLELGGSDPSAGIGFFSTQSIAAFLLGFGWAGVASLKGGLSVFWSAIIAFGCGLAAMSAMFFMLRGMLKLQSKGNMNFRNAVGSEGTVYVTLPGSDKDGGGQIEIMIQGRLMTAQARKTSPGELLPGNRVRVTGVIGESVFTVESAH